MQDPPPSNPNSHNNHHQLNSNNASHSHPPQPPKKSQPLPAITNTTTSFMKGGGHHRRAHSEVSFRLSDDMMMDLSPSDAFNGEGGCGGGGGGGGGSSTASLDEIGSEDDLFSTYIDVDKLGGADQSGVEGNGNGNGEKSGGGGGGGGGGGRGRHRHSSSVDGSSTTTSSTGVFGEIMDAKKAMPPDKLAELWNIDPKRAKRSCFLFFGFFGYETGFNFKISEFL